MSDTARNGKPYIWPTWITGLISGDKSCQWAAWYKAHFYHDKRVDENANALTRWTSEHAEMVRATAERERAVGGLVTLEDQNAFTYRGRSAVVGGKPDIISRKQKRVEIVECKSGKERGSDFVQVCVYMMLAPECGEDITDRELSGRIVYRDRVDRFIEPADMFKMKDIIINQIKRTSAEQPPPRTPSESECKFCDIASCPDRKLSTLEVEPDEGALF